MDNAPNCELYVGMNVFVYSVFCVKVKVMWGYGLDVAGPD
jgi:hypothetical protein